MEPHFEIHGSYLKNRVADVKTTSQLNWGKNQ